MSSELTYISAIQVKTYTSIDAVKVDVIKTLARWFPNTYVFGEHAVESWVQKEETEVYVLYNSTFQFELSHIGANVYELTMYAVGRFRRHGSSCDYFERVFDGLEHQLEHPNPYFATMTEAVSSKAAEECIDVDQYTPSNNVLPVASLDEDSVASLDLDEDSESEAESEDEDLDADEESDAEDEDELLMSMPLRDMTDNQVEEYTEMIGREPRDEINEWSMDYEGGPILRYSYVNFADETVSNQTVSDRTITRARFAGATLRNCVFEQVQFFECDFKSVVLENVTFTNSSFIDCELESYIVLHNSCTVENYDYEEDMARERLEDNVTYRFC